MCTRNRQLPAFPFSSLLTLLPHADAAPRITRYRVRNLGAPIGTDRVAPTSLNNRGQVVGFAYKHVPPGHGRPRDLRKLIPNTPRVGLGSPVDINDRGQILAYGSDRFGSSSGILLTPE